MAKYPAKGCKVYIEAANPPTVLIGQMADGDFDTGERDPLLDNTTHDTSGETREGMDNGWKKAPSVRGQLLWDPAATSHESLRTKQKTHGAGGLFAKVELPDAGGAYWVFPCRVQSLGIGMPVGDKLGANFVIEGLGADTFTA